MTKTISKNSGVRKELLEITDSVSKAALKLADLQGIQSEVLDRYCRETYGVGIGDVVIVDRGREVKICAFDLLQGSTDKRPIVVGVLRRPFGWDSRCSTYYSWHTEDEIKAIRKIDNVGWDGTSSTTD